jgi:hypothetical protein
MLVTGMLLLALPAGATNAGNAVGVGATLAVQNALTSVMVSAGPAHQEVSIPKRLACRSPFKPPEWAPKGPPAWANGKAYGLQADPPWKKWAETWQQKYVRTAKKGPQKKK